MSKATSLFLVCAGLAGSGITYGMVSRSDTDRREFAPQHIDIVTSPVDSDTMQAAAAGVWRAPRDVTGIAERTPATEVVTVQAVKAPVALPQKATSIPGDRGSLARELQRELSRVGCYDGEINGAWTTSTRQAMKTFTDRVNARLPIAEPNDVLLALVQGHQDRACGSSCPAGQGLSADGRCMPDAILALGARKDDPKRPAPVGWSTTTTLAPTLPSSLVEGQMALAGPKAEINAVTPSAERVQPAKASTETRRKVRDWRAELWERQAN